MLLLLPFLTRHASIYSSPCPFDGDGEPDSDDDDREDDPDRDCERAGAADGRAALRIECDGTQSRNTASNETIQKALRHMVRLYGLTHGATMW